MGCLYDTRFKCLNVYVMGKEAWKKYQPLRSSIVLGRKYGKTKSTRQHKQIKFKLKQNKIKYVPMCFTSHQARIMAQII